MQFAILTLFFLTSDSGATVVVQSAGHLFESAVCISSSPDGTLYVVDQKKNSVNHVTASNMLVRMVGGKGWGNTEFDFPTDVSSSFLLDIVAVDRNNRRIQRFDKQFNFVRSYDEESIPQLNGRFKPIACTFSSLGDLFVIEQDGNRIVKISARGVYEREFGTYREGNGSLIDPRDITVTANDEILVLDKSTVVLFDRFGNYIRTITLPGKNEWRTISVTGDNLCIVSPSEIRIFNLVTFGQQTIVPQSFLGAIVNEPFSDAVIQNSMLVVLTPTTLYRCSFP
jgi:hypothetical protein